MSLMSVGEATQVVQMLLTLESKGIITMREAISALKKVPHYCDIITFEE